MDILAFLPAYVGYDHNAGAELTMHEMLVALRLRGHRVTVLLSRPIPDNMPYVIDGIKVQTYASKKDLIFHASECDLIISHLECAERAAYVARAKKKPIVQLIHNDHFTTYQGLEAGCDLAVFNSHQMAERYKAYRTPSCVLHPPVRPSVYGGDRGKMVTLVNLWRNKGAALFYALAKRNPDIQFLGVKGGYEEQIVEELPNVSILENTGDIRTAYRQTKVVLVPSAYESYGRVPLEAAASGIPAIVSPTPGLKEALGDGATFVDAPQVDVPGAKPAEWTEAQIDAWDKALKKVLTPAGYGKASKKALARSQEVWLQTETELTAFCERVERLA